VPTPHQPVDADLDGCFALVARHRQAAAGVVRGPDHLFVDVMSAQIERSPTRQRNSNALLCDRRIASKVDRRYLASRAERRPHQH
jgi:hypothetical protein